MTEVIKDLITVISAFCKSNRHGIIEIHVRNHVITGIKENATNFVKLPLEKRTD